MKRLFQRAGVVIIVVLLVWQVLVPVTPVQAATIYTITYAGDEFGGNIYNCSLREAIHAANTDKPYDGCPAGSGTDLIILQAKDYQLTSVVTGIDEYTQGDLDIYTSMTIVGAGAHLTKIMGVGLNNRIFHIQTKGTTAAPSVNISYLTINGGSVPATSTYGGGGIFLQAGSLILSWVELSSNSAPSGGGVLVFRNAAKFKADAVVFRANSATGTSGAGGAIYNESIMIIEKSLLVGNSAPASGGGIDNRPFDATDYGLVSNTTITSNTSDNGAGIATSGPGELRLYNSTVARNTGAGLFANDSSIVKMRQTIMAINSSPNCRKSSGSSVATLLSDGFNLIKDNPSQFTEQCVFTYPNPIFDGTDIENAAADPMLSQNLVPAYTAQTFMQWFEFTSTGSPAIDAIDPIFARDNLAPCPSRDQLYYLRPAGDGCEIGAIEYGAKAALKPLYISLMRR